MTHTVRPDPDALLTRVKEEEAHQRRGLLSRREYRAKHGLNLPAETDAALDALMPWNYAGATAEAGTAK